ncbi:MAG TPA: hypothetical protein VGM90_03870 [Kofleriaceae bacterium]|jgi:hypothetical protein
MSDPAFTDAASVRTAFEQVKTAEDAKKLREYADRNHEWRAASLRYMPEKFFTKKDVVNEYQLLTELFARIRGIKAFKPADPNQRFRFSAYEEFLTDDELDAVRVVIMDTRGTTFDKDQDREIEFTSEQLATRFLARISDKDLCTLWPRFDLSAWVAIRAMSDAQLLMLFALGNEQQWFGNQGCLTFEVFRRGLMTETLLTSRLAGFDRRENEHSANLVAEYWVDPPRSGGEYDPSSVEKDVSGYQTVHRNVLPFVEQLRAWLSKIASTVIRASLFQDGKLLLLCFIVWNDDVAKLVREKWKAGKDDYKDKYKVMRASENIANGLTGAPHADAIVSTLEENASGKRMETVIEQAKARLANRRALLTGEEKIEWGRTDNRDAFQMIQRFTKPTSVIEQGLTSDDPVAVINAWAVSGSLYWERKNRKLEPALPSADHLVAALEKLERIYTTDAPDHAALQQLIGILHTSSRLFDTGFKAATDRDDKRVWNRAAELYRTTTNVRYKEWIEPYLRFMDESLVEPIAVKLARLAKECAEDASLKETVERCIITRSDKAPTKATVNRLFGDPIGVDAKRWPTSGKKTKTKMEHVITLDADVLGPDERRWLAKDTAAVAVFVDNIAEGFKDSTIVEITAAQLKKATAGKKSAAKVASQENGIALDVIRMQVPTRVFQGGKKTGSLFELRKVFDRTDLIVPGNGPHFIQEAEGGPDFLFEIDSAFAVELNLGDVGRMFVYSSEALFQSH